MYRLMMSGTVAGEFFRVAPVTCLVGLVWAVCRWGKAKRKGLAFAWKTEILRWLFVCYLTGLANLILTPNNLWTFIWSYLYRGYSGVTAGPLFAGSFNFVPTVFKWLTGELTVGSWVLKMLVVNVLMFVPMGMLLPLVFGKLSGRNMVPLAALIPLAVEVIQPVMGRSFDVDDIISNFLGIILGYLLTAVFRALRKKRIEGLRDGDG